MIRRFTLLALLIGIAFTLGSPRASSKIVTIDGFSYGQGSMLHAYVEKYGKPAREPLPEWVEHFVWDVLGSRGPGFDYTEGIGFAAPRTKYDAAEALLDFIPGRRTFPGRLNELSKDPEMLEETRRVIEYLTPEIIFVLAARIDTIHWTEQEEEVDGYRKWVLNQIDGLVRLAALPGRSGEKGEGYKEMEE